MLDDVINNWERWAGSARGARQLRTWARHHPALAGWSTTDLRSPSTSAATDAMQAVLVAEAQRGDPAAAATLLVQLRPGLVALTRWAASSDRRFATFDDAAAEVTSAFGEVVMRHRLDRRPRRIAANLLLDTKQRIWRDGGRQARLDDVAVAAARAGDPGIDAVDRRIDELALVDTVARTLVALGGTPSSRRLSAEVAYRAWVMEESSSEIAVDTGLAAEAVRTRLCRLRRQIRSRWLDQDTSRSEGSAPPSRPVGPSTASRQ